MGKKASLEKVIDRAVRRMLADPALAGEAHLAALACAMGWLDAQREVAAFEKAHRDRRQPGKAGRAASGPMVAGAEARASHRPVEAPPVYSTALRMAHSMHRVVHTSLRVRSCTNY